MMIVRERAMQRCVALMAGRWDAGAICAASISRTRFRKELAPTHVQGRLRCLPLHSMIQLVNTHDERLIVDILNAFQQHYKSLNLPFLSAEKLFSFLKPSEQALINRLSQTEILHTTCTEPADFEEHVYVSLQRQQGIPGVRVHREIAAAFLAMADVEQAATGQCPPTLTRYAVVVCKLYLS